MISQESSANLMANGIDINGRAVAFCHSPPAKFLNPTNSWESQMKIKQQFLGVATVCMLCAAALMTQSMMANSARANTPGNRAGSLLKRVQKLELRQDQDDTDFQLVDLTLEMIQSQIEEAKVRASARRNDLQKLRTELNKLGIPVDKLQGETSGSGI